MNSHRSSIFILACMWMCGHAIGQAPDLQRMDIVLKSVPDGPVAKVFGTNIPSQRFVRFYEAELKRIRSAVGAESLSPQARLELGMWCIQKLVEQEILYQDGVRNKVKITREELERSWSEQLGSFRASLQGSAVGSLTEDEVLEKIGVGSREEALGEVRRARTILKMRTRIVEKAEIEVDESKVAETYSVAKERLNTRDKIHLRQIFFRADAGDTSAAKRLRADARNRANDSMARIDAGQSVASIATSVSNAPDRKAGGDMGLQRLADLPPFMVEAALSMEVGDVSEVIESDFGFHIIELVAVHSSRESTLKDMAPIIRDRLAAREGDRVVREYCNSLIQGAGDVQVYLELEKNMSLLSE